jgi:uncharacterized protein (TIGR02246 family)
MKARLAALAAVSIMLSTIARADEVPAWASELLQQWYEANQAQDGERMANLYTADAWWGDARGRAAIRAGFEAEWATRAEVCVNDGFEGFRVVGNVAVGWGRDTCEVRPADGSPGFQRTTRWLAVYERQPDGRWLTSRDQYEEIADP